MVAGRMVNYSLRRLYYDYSSEFLFVVILTTLAVVSFYFSRYIPLDIFEDIISPLQMACIITVCLFGGWTMLRHSEGMRLRKLWAVTLFIWAFGEIGLFTLSILYEIPITKAGVTALDGNAMVIGNGFAWLLYLYPTAALRPRWLTVWRALLFYLPLPVIGAVAYFFSIDLRWLLALYPMCIVILLISHIRAYHRWCEENFSSMEHIDARWIVRYLLMLLIVGASYYYICVSHAPSRVFTQQWMLLVMLAYSTEQILYRRDPWENMGVIEGEIAVTEEEKAAEEESKAIEENKEQTEANRAILEAWMASDKPYLNPEFKLMDLRAVLPLNRTYLSQLINLSYGCNFYQFVTNYRMEEAKRLMREYPEMKMQEVAEQSGFASSAVFSRTFTRETGMSPREWCKENDNS